MLNVTGNRTTGIVNSSNTGGGGHTSTLLIPEAVVWLPYVGLILTVVLWLGYDFYKFHERNRVKYIRIEEHMRIQRSSSQRHRINMISGVRLRFRHGKPVLGDVLCTTPSSSDIYNFCSPLIHSSAAGYRENTPDEGGSSFHERENLEVLPQVHYMPVPFFANSKVQEYKNRQIGNDHHDVSTENEETKTEQKIHRNCGHTFTTQTENHIMKSLALQGLSTTLVSASPAANCSVKNMSPTESTDGDYSNISGCTKGKARAYSRVDVSTQTYPIDFVLNASPDEQKVPAAYQGQIRMCSRIKSNLKSPRHRNMKAIENRLSSEAIEHTGLSSSEIILSDLAKDNQPTKTDSASRKCSSNVGSNEKFPVLKLGSSSVPHSPTVKILASNCFTSPEGIQPIHDGGSSPVPLYESDLFQPLESTEDHAPHADVTTHKSSACRISRSSNKDHSQHHHSRHKKCDNLNIRTPGGQSSRALKSCKRTSQSLNLPPSSQRNVMSSQGIVDFSGESLRSTLHPPLSAPIPSHLYHHDEEMFFSTTGSSSSPKLSMKEADDCSKKGILFFSRMSNRGRSQDQKEVDGAGKQRVGSGGFSCGGFES